MLKTSFIRVIYLFTVTSIACVFFGYLNGSFEIADTLSHFRLHFIFVLLFFSLLLALITKYVSSFILLIGVILFSIPIFPSLFVLKPPIISDGLKTIKVIQINLSFRNKSLGKVKEYIYQKRPDFVTFQEVTGVTSALLKNIKDEYKYQFVCDFSTVGGVAIVSRFPIIKASTQDCVKKTGFAWIRIKIHGREITIGSLHLHWPYPHRQWKQIYKLSKTFREMPKPVILAGDFNAAPWSHAVYKIAQESTTRVAKGLRFTLEKRPFSYLPPILLPIDHILYSEEISLNEISIGPKVGSDHFPLFAVFHFSEP